MSEADPKIAVEYRGPVATLVLNRPQRRNALDFETWVMLLHTLERLEADEGVRVVIVRGAGDQAFSAGADIKEFAELLQDRERLDENNRVVQQAQIALEEFSKPTIALIRGACMGGGCGIALACDFRLADPASRFGITPAKLGLLYSERDTRRLHRLVGPALTRRMLFTGAALSGEQALAAGLVDQLFEGDSLEQEVYALAEELSGGSRYSLRGIKAIIGHIEGSTRYSDEDIEQLIERAFDGEDFQEGRCAFLEKRPANFNA
jgi:enoyl-CoA hydratase/carnithine racemase